MDRHRTWHRCHRCPRLRNRISENRRFNLASREAVFPRATRATLLGFSVFGEQLLLDSASDAVCWSNISRIRWRRRIFEELHGFTGTTC